MFTIEDANAFLKELLAFLLSSDEPNTWIVEAFQGKLDSPDIILTKEEKDFVLLLLRLRTLMLK